ncbi:Nucleolar protein 16 [Ascosphaera acerosa]|nr:Nucleolar protein 16 [Ascosphaera acerosa]
MGREIQKRKNRSGITRVKQKTKRTKAGKKKIDVVGNAIIAANCLRHPNNRDKNLTLAQNYRKLGLSASLNAPTGGTEHKPAEAGGDAPLDPLHSLAGPSIPAATSEVRVERDPETGAIVRVVRGDGDDDDDDAEVEIAGVRRRKANPLDDPLEDVMRTVARTSAPSGQETTGAAAASSEVVRQLEIQAAREEEALKHRKPRHMSQREAEWVERLVRKHGQNVAAMVRDKRLNPMQQTEADIRRRIAKWRSAAGRQGEEQSTST